MRAALAFTRRINIRHWREHRLRTALTTLGIVAGVGLIVAVTVVNSTLVTAVTGTAERLAGRADLEVAAPDSTGFPQRLVGEISEAEGVDHAIPVLRTYSRITGPGGNERTLLLGVTPSFPLLFEETERAALSTSGGIEGPQDTLLAAGTAATIGVSVGEEFAAEVPGGTQTFRLAGTFSGSGTEGFGDFGVLPLPSAQEAFGRVGKVDSVYVLSGEGVSARALEARLQAGLGAAAVVGPPGFRGQGFDSGIDGIASLTSLAGVVALFVAAFVVFTTMSMSIAERRREISLSLAMGASRRQVLTGFLTEAGLLGAVASVVGVGLGYLLARAFVEPGLDGLLVYGVTAQSGASLGVRDVLVGMGAGMGVSLIGAYLPARRISSVAPVESLRPQSLAPPLVSSQPGWRIIARLVLGLTIVGVGAVVGRTAGLGSDGIARTNVALVLILVGATMLLPLGVVGALRVIRGALRPAAPLTLRLGIESLLRNSGRTTMTVGALVFTLGIVVAVGSALHSYETEWERSAGQWHGGPIQVAAPSYILMSSDQPLPPEIATSLERVEGVRSVYPVHFRVVNVDGRQTTIYVSDYIGQKGDPAVAASGGHAFREALTPVLERGDVVVSALSARNKGLDIGDRFTIPTPSGPSEVTVGEIVTDLNPLDSVFLSKEMFYEHWGVVGVDRFEVSHEAGSSVEEVIDRIETATTAQGTPVTVMTKSELMAHTFAPIAELFSVARGIQLAALIIAALAIANAMFIAVLERRWEFGLQRVVGMDARSLGRTLLGEAGLMGCIGTLGAWIIGIGMGYLMVLNSEDAYAFSLPFELPLTLMTITLLLGVVIALAAGAYPSRAAFRTPIIEALRTE